MVAQRDPIRAWREQYARQCLHLDFEPLAAAPFQALVRPILAEPCVLRTVHSPGLTFRDEELVKDGDERFSLMISQSRNLRVAHQRRDLALGRGDATLLHVCETGSVGSHDDVGYIVVLIAPAEWDARGARAGDAIMQRLPGRSDVLQLLRDYIRSLEKSPINSSAEAQETVGRHVIDLVVLAATSRCPIGESGASAIVAARLAAALDHIAACFQDPELSIAAVAHSQGISPRYLQRLLESSGICFTARVNALRLQRALTLLSEEPTRRISDIALDTGFSDISHFNRLFRARFGDTPSGVRAQGGRGG